MTLHVRRLVPCALALACAAAAPAHAATPAFFFTDTPYLSAADVPAGFYAGGAPAFLEDFEDGSLGGQLVGSGGGIIVAGAFDGLRDSVDGDDGTLDGTCGPQGSRACGSWFDSAGQAVTYTYTGAELPTAFGVVWTDGSSGVTLTAFDGNGVEIGAITRSGFVDTSFGSTTAEDRFFGVTYAGGIGAIRITTIGAVELDHVQYGTMAPVPEPPAWALLAAGGLLAAARLRRRPAR